jgi:hypothetical protein
MSLLAIFVEFPWLALVPAMAFGALGYRCHRKIAWIAAIAWLLYAAYEMAMRLKFLCPGECDIRVDLLLIYPVLLALTIAAALDGALAAQRARRLAIVDAQSRRGGS